MKRITTLVLAAALAFGSIGAAHADGIDIKVKGQWDFAFGWANNARFTNSVHNHAGDRDNDNFIARHRVRTQVNFITSEYLQGVVMFEIGNLDWGRDSGNTGGRSKKSGRGSGGDLDADGVNIETKRAYLDWIIPHTDISVRMGIQGITLPSTALGPIVMDADVAGIVVNAPINDMFSIVALWVRPFDATDNDDDRRLHDETDIFGLLLPVKGDGWAVTPYGLYGFVGANSGFYEYAVNSDDLGDAGVGVTGNKSKIWYLGFNFDLSVFDPLTFGLDAVYGRVSRIDAQNAITGADGRLGTAGWYIGATLDYKLDWGTPGLFGWWASGDKSSDVREGKLGRMPSVMTDGAGFTPTTFGFAGTYSIGTDSAIGSGPGGTWGIGIQLADVSFIEDLSHTLRVAYYRGTNDEDVVRDAAAIRLVNDNIYLTKKDSVIEVNFDHTYKIYENLTAVLELGYLHLKADEDVWSRGSDYDETENAWKAELMFQYKF